MKYNVKIPLGDKFKTWLFEEGITTTEKSASSYVSRLRRLFFCVLDEFFPKKKNKKEIRPFHDIFNELHENDKETAAELLNAMRELAFDKRYSQKRTNIPEESYSDCRTALEKYIEFYGQNINSVSGKVSLDDNELAAIKDTIDTYNKKEFTRKELYDNIRFRRRTEGRYTGDIYYPIELIDTVFKYHHSEDTRTCFEEWLTKIVDKIQILIDKNGQSITFKKLRDNDFGLKIEKRKVFIYQQNGKDWEQVYTHTNEEGEVRPMEVAIFQSIDIDHKVAISNMLNENDYPALAKLTNLITDANFPKKGKKEQVKYLRGTFYSNNKKFLEGMVDKIKDDLNRLLEFVEFEMMDGHYNKKKSNK